MIWRLCSQNQWNYERAKNKLAEGEWRDQVVEILYRPFDIRWTVFNPNVAVHGRERVMRHMLAGENLALISARTNKSPIMDHFFCSTHIVETKCGESTVQSYTFPLYLYPSADRTDLFAHHEPSERQPNLNPALVSALAQAFSNEPSPEEIFHYIYAVFYAPAYREKYAEFLRMDFPRVPFTADAELFQKLAVLGARLTTLHLLNSPELDPPACRFEGEGDSRIGKGKSAGPRYEAGEQRVYINATQYFAPVAEAVWSYQVGGYQVCQKWLKDRQGRHLELDDIRTYWRIVTALGLTLDIQKQIDLLYPDVEKNVVSIPGHASEVKSGVQPSHPTDAD